MNMTLAPYYNDLENRTRLVSPLKQIISIVTTIYKCNVLSL